MKKRLLQVTLILCMATTLLGGCKKKVEETETEELVVAETETEPETEETREGMLKSYFTGEWIDEEIAKKRPVAVMTENTQYCLPQFGLNRTAIVYECPTEATVTRLMAIYQDYSGMEKIGNIRSCRHYYCYFAHEYDCIYVHAGKSPKGKKVLDSGYIDHIDGGGSLGTYFFRDSSEHVAPHNYYTSSENIDGAIEKSGFETQLSEDFESHFQFADEKEPVMLENGNPANVVSLYYRDCKPYFVYNEEDGMYYRYEFGKPQMDGVDNTQLVTKNIIIQNCESKVIDDALRLDIKHKGEGTGYYITNGKCIEITWSRENKNTITHYYDKEGNEIVINPGRTWVEIAENDYSQRNQFYNSLEEYEQAQQ